MELVENKNLLDSVDARTRLAGSNKMEILLFTLGTREIFGINVFKVREVGRTPRITKTPNMPRGVEGLISLRGNVIPVLSLAPFMHLDGAAPGLGKTMMVAEYSKRTLGFLVHEVDRIIRVDWERVKAPESVLSANQGLITAVIELEGGGLVSILDVEQILANAFGEAMIVDITPARVDPDTSVFFVDDSIVARRKISEVLDKLGVRHKHATNGLEAWTRLQGIAAHALQSGRNIRDEIRLILVDAEMPEMDGYVLTKNIKSDVRFEGVPVVMHSSLSSEANRAMGKSVGVDAYVAKFDAEALADTLRPLIERQQVILEFCMAADPKMKFLVVDDFSTMRRIVRNLLKELGFTNVDEAEDGAIALQKLQGGGFEFVVTDWNMPNMDGLTLLQTIRATPNLKHLPVLMITAEAKKENIIAAAQAGASGYIVKPFTAGTLSEKLNKIFEKMGQA